MKDEVKASLPEDFTGLLIGIPNLSGEMRTELTGALVKASVLMTDFGMDFGVYWVMGSSAVERTRNSIISHFLKEDRFSHLLMIDDDMDCDYRDIVKIVANGHELCFAAGVKKKKPTSAKPEFALFPLGRENPICPHCGCVEMAAGGACFMLVSKDVIRRMIDAFPDLWYVSEDDPNERVPALFNPYINPETHIYRAEDVAFYDRYRSIGGRVWLDMTIKLGHWGKARWSGDLKETFTFVKDTEE